MTTKIATLSATKKILSENNLDAKKGLGQNFLVDQNIIDNIITRSSLTSDTVVLEIGAGLGALTESLSHHAKHVLSIEVDYELIPLLQKRFNDLTNVEIIHDDILKMNLSEELKEYKDEKIIVIANLPYYITSDILIHLSESDIKFDEIIVMMQLEVADRLLSNVDDSNYRAMTVMMQNQYQIKKILDVSRHVFYPKPQVSSAVLSFKPINNQENNWEFNQFVKQCFMMRRKTIYNNLKAFTDPSLSRFILKEAQIKESLRPQNISVNQYQRMFEVYDEEKSTC